MTALPNPQELDRCEMCGIVIGGYKVGRRTVKTTYKYPICVNCDGKFYSIDLGCYEYLQYYKEYHPAFDACDDILLGEKTPPTNGC